MHSQFKISLNQCTIKIYAKDTIQQKPFVFLKYGSISTNGYKIFLLRWGKCVTKYSQCYGYKINFTFVVGRIRVKNHVVLWASLNMFGLLKNSLLNLSDLAIYPFRIGVLMLLISITKYLYFIFVFFKYEPINCFMSYYYFIIIIFLR